MDMENLHGWTVLPGSSKHSKSVCRLTRALEMRPTPSVGEEESVDELDFIETETNKRKATASTPRLMQRPPKFPRIGHEQAPASPVKIANGFSDGATWIFGFC
jgi:hypothetical protein